MVELAERNREFAERSTDAGVDLEQAIGRDPLTNLFNRLMMGFIGNDIVERRKANNDYLSVFLIDLDSFKEINDKKGHAAGDLLLQKVAEALVVCFRSEDYSFRLGGDEFVVVAPVDHKGAEQLLERLRNFLDDVISFSSGVVTKKLSPADSVNLEELIAEADRRMYAEKTLHHQKLAMSQAA